MPTIRAIATLLLLLTVAGCFRGEERLYPVSGRVTVGGVPLTSGDVVLTPDPERDNKHLDCPMGVIESDGNYTVATRNRPGAKAGAYKVMVLATRNKPEARIDWVPIWAVDVKYTKRETTDLRIEVVPTPAEKAYDLNLPR